MAKKHFSLSPSAAHRWLVCPGEPKARASAPYKPAGFYADEGTTAHWVGENCVRTDRKPTEFIGLRCPETDIEVTAEMVDAVEHYVDFCQAIKAQALKWGVEGNFAVDHISAQLRGTTDFYAILPDTLVIADYKHGKGHEVDAEWNPQLLIYFLGVLRHVANKYPELLPGIKQAVIVIVQPRTGGEAVDRFEVDLEKVTAWQDLVLAPAVRRTETDSDHRVAGSHCVFCPVKATCPSMAELADETTQSALAERTPAFPDVKSLPVEKLETILEHKAAIEDWLNSVGVHLQEYLEQGGKLTKFKLVNKKSNRVWRDGAEAAVARMLGKAGWTKPELISPSQAEKQILKPLGLDLPEELVVKPTGALTIAPMSDKRTAVSPKLSALDDFLEGTPLLEE